MLRTAFLIFLATVSPLAGADVSSVALDPYLLAQYINGHPSVDLGPLRVVLRMDDPAVLGQSCVDADCHAEVIKVSGSNYEQAIVWNYYKSRRAAFWLRYQREPSTPWQFLSGNHVEGKSSDPEREVITAFGKPFFVVRGAGPGGTGVTSRVETWFDLTVTNAQPVVAFTKEGSRTRGCEGCIVKTLTTVVKPQDVKPVELRVERTVHFGVPAKDSSQTSIDLGSITALVVYLRPDNGPFKLAPSLSSVPKNVLESVFDISDESGMANEVFLKYDIANLRKIANDRQTPAAQWLTTFLRACKETPEKTELLRQLR